MKILRMGGVLLSCLIIGLSGCAGNPITEAETPAQKFYAAVGVYNTYAVVAANYVESPSADPTAKEVIKRIDAEAQSAIDEVLRAGVESRGDKYIFAAKILRTLTSRLRSELIKEGVIGETSNNYRGPLDLREVTV